MAKTKKNFTAKKNIIVSILAISALALGIMTGCGSNAETVEPEQAAVEETAEQPMASNFAVEINGCTVTEDYEGNPAVVIESTWTNNGNETICFENAIWSKVFQNGIQVERATISCDNENYDMEASWNEVKPGATQTVYQAFLIDGDSEIIAEEYDNTYINGLTMDYDMLATKTFALA